MILTTVKNVRIGPNPAILGVHMHSQWDLQISPAVSQPFGRSEYAMSSRKTDRFSRSKQMVNALRQEFIYSEKRSRDILFREIQEILSTCEIQPIVSRLTREAAFRARRRAAQVGYELANWDTAAKATINSMLRAGALVSQDGVPIALTITAQAAPVFALNDGYQDLTEAHLLEFLVRKLGDVTVRDHTALAHALFRQFDRNISMEDLEDRVVYLFAGLSGRLVLASDGTYFPVDLAN